MCNLRMQVTHVRKPLMSVSRVCDQGHEVIFRRDGGVIRHITTGQETSFVRRDGVYRMSLKMMKPCQPFGRQEK